MRALRWAIRVKLMSSLPCCGHNSASKCMLMLGPMAGTLDKQDSRAPVCWLQVAGGGRSSARETIGRVAAGAVAKKLLKLIAGVEVLSVPASLPRVVQH